MGRATINCPFLKSPMDGFGGSVFFEDGSLRIEGLDARVGKRGRIHVGGVLPVHASKRRHACWLKPCCAPRIPCASMMLQQGPCLRVTPPSVQAAASTTHDG